MKRVLLLILAAFAATVQAQQAGAPLFSDNYAKTPSELSAISPTGGAGGSGNAKVQVVTILGNPSQPAPIANCYALDPTHPFLHTIMPGTASVPC